MRMLKIALLFLPLALMAADDKKPESTPPGVPSGATKVAPYTYRLSDKDGKTWIYRQTPFGYSKAEEKAQDAKETPLAPPPPTKVKDLGDRYRFERQGMMGKMVWERKKTELTDDEKYSVDAAKN